MLRQRLRIDLKSLGERAHQPVDGGAFLCSAREIHAAQHRARLVAAALKHFREEGTDVLLEARHLFREAVNQTAALDVTLLSDTGDQPLVQTPNQQIKLAAEMLGWTARRIIGIRERHAPHLLALTAAEIVEELRESGDEIALRKQHVHREPDAEVLVQLHHAFFHREDVGATLLLGLREEIGHRKRNEDAVDRTPATMLLQEVEKPEPPGLVDLRIAVLGRVPPGRIDQDGVVREPPVAIARAADAPNCVGAEAIGERKSQPGIHERGRLTRARRADDHVPGQIVETEAPFAPARLLQDAERLFEAILDRVDLVARDIGCHGRDRHGNHRLDDLLVRFGRSLRLDEQP